MNTPLRRLATVVMAMFVVLIGSATWVQYVQADKLNNDSRNVRGLYREYGNARGPIVVGGTAVAFSTPVDDPYGYQRQYTDGTTYSAVTGFYSIVNGKSELENAANGELTGRGDRLFFTRIRDLITGRKPEGAAIETTINPAAQAAAVAGLGDQQGAVVAIEPSTGKILALVSTPGFDPNTLATHDTAAASAAYQALDAAPGNPLRSNAIKERYAPGSTFKLITAAAALESGQYTPDSTLPAPHQLDLPQTTATIGNFGGEGCGSDPITLADALRVSCNTAFAQLGLNLGADALQAQAEKFGFNETGQTIPMLVVQSVFPDNLNAPETAQSAIGQRDVQATPLEMAMVSAAIANGGRLMTPYVVDAVRSADLTTVNTTKPTLYSTAVSPATAAALTQMMVGVVQSGSGTAAQIPGVQVAGKTGTAQTGTDQAPHAWFTAFAPADNPKVAVAVLVEHGGSLGNEATGGRIAAPIAKAVIQAVLGSMKTAAGVALGERYRLVRQIAVGGMGEVWEAHDDALARPVAVKVLRSEFAGDRGFLERFRTEARNSASLSHPNIAQLFDYGEQDGSGFLVMELVVGEPLSDLLEREPVLPTRRLLPILAQTARGLHAAHIAGVVHRDVKPGNILLGRGGRVKITDFGVSLARNQVTMTATGMVMGTAQYLSPEQAVGQPATPLSDLYSLGIIAYESLVGHRPFTGPTAVDIAVAHVNNPVPPLPASVDKPLADLVLSLLSKEPARRPQSGEELAELLDTMVPRTPPSGVPMLVEQPMRTPDRFATAATPIAPQVPPPSYPPRRTRRLEEPATPRRTRVVPPPVPAPNRWSRPVLILILLLVALLGAFAAHAVLKADGPADPSTVLVAAAPPGTTDPRPILAGYASAGDRDAMIAPYDSAEHGLATPALPGTAPTEAEDA